MCPLGAGHARRRGIPRENIVDLTPCRPTLLYRQPRRKPRPTLRGITTMEYAEITTTRHTVEKLSTGAAVGELVATWGDDSLIRIQGFGQVSRGVLEMARHDFGRRAERAEKLYRIVPPLD